MERTKHAPKTINTNLEGNSVVRAFLSAYLGMQYGGERNLFQALGYPQILTFQDFLGQYTRGDIAKAVIDRPVKATWQGQLELVESQEAQKTPFEQAWFDLNKRLKLRTLFSRVDRLTGIGRYGVLFLGFNDVRSTEEFQKPVSTGTLQLKYIKPFGEQSAKISTFEIDPTNERYGLPVLYDIQVADVASQKSTVVKVHYTRIIHITQDNLESEVYGTPTLESIFNRLMDVDKVVGGSAEMFWRGARPGFQGKVDKDYQMSNTLKEDLKNQIDEYENDLRRILVNEGVDLQALAQQIADPKNNLDVLLTCISAVTGIPKRILSGSERGELASTQDSGEWKTYVQSRREDHAEPNIIRPFVDKMIEFGILPEPGVDYTIDWLDLFSVSEKDRVDIGKARANAIREYTTNPMAEAIMPPDAFFELCLGLSTQQIDLVHKMIESGISEEQKELIEEMLDITTPELPETEEPSSAKETVEA